MSNWTKSHPCPNCQGTQGHMLKCTNCGTLGCPKCVGHPGDNNQCHVCRKHTEIIKV